MIKKIIISFIGMFLLGCTFHVYEYADKPDSYKISRTPRATPIYFYDNYTPYRVYPYSPRYRSPMIYRYPTYLGPVQTPNRSPLVEPKEDPRRPRRAVPRRAPNRPDSQIPTRDRGLETLTRERPRPTADTRRRPIRRDTIR